MAGRATRPSPTIGGPLPVVYAEALFTYHPKVGHGRLQVGTWQDTGSDDCVVTYAMRPTGLGPFDDSRLPTYAGHLWNHLIAQITDWPDLRGAFPKPSEPFGVTARRGR